MNCYLPVIDMGKSSPEKEFFMQQSSTPQATTELANPLLANNEQLIAKIFRLTMPNLQKKNSALPIC